jgi:hypothetical protein
LVGYVQEPSADEASERLIGDGWLQIGRGLEHPGGGKPNAKRPIVGEQ